MLTDTGTVSSKYNPCSFVIDTTSVILTGGETGTCTVYLPGAWNSTESRGDSLFVPLVKDTT